MNGPRAGFALLGIHRGQERSRALDQIRQFVANPVAGNESQHAKDGDCWAAQPNDRLSAHGVAPASCKVVKPITRISRNGTG